MNTNKRSNENCLVSFETAIALRKAKYPQYETEKSYFRGKRCVNLEYGELLGFKPVKGNKYSVAAPRISEVVDWMRERKGLFVEITRCPDPKKRLYFWRIIQTDNGEKRGIQENTRSIVYKDSNVGSISYECADKHKSYYGCCEEAINYYLKNILKII